MDNKEFLKLIEKYNQGWCTQDELQKLDGFCQELQQHPYPETLSSRQEKALKTKLYQRIENKISTKPNTTGIPRFSYALRWAAVLVVLIGVASLLPLFFSQEPVLITASTGFGEHKTVVFEDGSKVYLSTLSSITYPESFSNVRNVKLEGEGFFEVTKDENKPFIVESGTLFTKVLGTTFGIKAYPNDETLEVALATGKVQVSQSYDSSSELSKQQQDNSKAFVLDPKMMVVLHKEKDSMYLKPTDLKAVFAHRKGILYFEKEPLAQVAKTLSRHYDVQFEFTQESLKEISISGEMKPDTLPNLLENLKFLTGLDFIKDQKRIVIQKPASL